ncbi:hypothetical protein AWW66_13535 [Micromonospora rosaria]|uniref:Flavin reductase n=1 Tax=Micromonospora rosaria TaxID=47874 RepID=A0A136PSI4_9ACTN|nr:hypothetical protein AWW66_13535 [Micromonospora rosaria]
MNALPSPGPAHVPSRPSWACAGCGAPWPCPAARTNLTGQYAERTVDLAVYLCMQLHDATGDLLRHHPDDLPGPAEFHARFVGWVRHRRQR